MGDLQEISFAGSCKPFEFKPYVSPDQPRICNMDGTPCEVKHKPRRRRSVFVARRTHARRRGAGRPRAQSTRSSVKSGDSPDDAGDLDDPAPGWCWRQPPGWLPGRGDVETAATTWRPSLRARVLDALNPSLRRF